MSRKDDWALCYIVFKIFVFQNSTAEVNPVKPSLLLLLAFAMLPCAAARAQSTESADDTNIWINGFIALRGGDANAGTDSFPDPLYLVSTTGRYMLYKDVTDVSIASYPSCNTANCPPFYYV